MKLFLTLCLLSLALPIRIQAYLDPGTGSYITQLAIGGLVGGLYLFKLYFAKIVSFIKDLLAKFSRREKTSKKS